MRTKLRSLLLLSTALAAALSVAAGCKKSGDKPGAGGTGDTAKGGGPAGGPDFAAWDSAARQKAWQGSWLVKENGTVQAWTIKGDQVQTWDGKEDKTFTLTFTAPCRAQFGDGKGMTMPREFTVVDGKLQYRGDGAGYRKGKEALWCDMSGDFYTVDAAGACTLWKADDFGKKYTKEPGECGFKPGAGGAEVFFHEGVNSGEFELRGDAIVSSTSFETEQVAGDHAAAKAARDAKAAP